MKQRKLFLKLQNHIVLVFLYISLVLINFSCKENDKGATEPTSDTLTKEETTIQTTSIGKFYSLKLDIATLQQLLQPTPAVPPLPPVKKLIFQFVDSNQSGTDGIGLIAYGLNPKGQRSTGPVGLTPVGTVAWDTTGVKILGNLELSLRKLKNVLNQQLPNNSPIPPADYKNVYLHPYKDSDNHITYIISLNEIRPEIKVTTNTPPLNPSPPAPPCETGCDQN